MTQVEFVRLYNSTSLTNYVGVQARRHANNPDDIDDFKQEAWARIALLSSGCSTDTVGGEAYRAIHAAYERERRRRCHEIPFSRMT